MSLDSPKYALFANVVVSRWMQTDSQLSIGEP